VGVEHVFVSRAAALGTHARAVREHAASSPVEEGLTVRYSVTARPTDPGGTTLVDVRGIHGTYPGLALVGPAYQAGNIATGVATAEAALGRALDPDRARAALAALAIPGRFELMRREPPVLIAASPNPQAAAVLADAVRDAWPGPERRPVLLLGIFADKDAGGIIEALAPVAGAFAVTRSVSPRAMPTADLARLVERISGTAPLVVADTVGEALGALGSCPPYGLVVTGSIATAGEARALLRDTSATSPV
jgi:dihydrofolate synthase/folylpolyglutamate synthase